MYIVSIWSGNDESEHNKPVILAYMYTGKAILECLLIQLTGDQSSLKMLTYCSRSHGQNSDQQQAGGRQPLTHSFRTTGLC